MPDRHIRRITSVLLIAAALVTIAPALVAGPGPTDNNPAIVPINGTLDGQTYSGLSAKWWQWGLGLTNADSPIFTNGTASCENGQSGNVWFLIGTFVPAPTYIECSVPIGTALFFPIVNAECSNLEPAPYHGDTPAQRAACAQSYIDFVTNLTATIDGIPVQNLLSYRVQSGDFPIQVPADNLFGVPGPAQGLSTSDGYFLLLPPLAAGTHTIHFTATQCDPAPPHSCTPGLGTIDTTYIITVPQNLYYLWFFFS